MGKKFIWALISVIVLLIGSNIYLYQSMKNTEEELENSYLAQYWFILQPGIAETIAEMETYLETEDEALLRSIDTRLYTFDNFINSITHPKYGAVFFDDITRERLQMARVSYLSENGNEDEAINYVQDMVDLLNSFWESRDEFEDYEQNLRDIIKLSNDLSLIRNEYVNEPIP